MMITKNYRTEAGRRLAETQLLTLEVDARIRSRLGLPEAGDREPEDPTLPTASLPEAHKRRHAPASRWIVIAAGLGLVILSLGVPPVRTAAQQAVAAVLDALFPRTAETELVLGDPAWPGGTSAELAETPDELIEIVPFPLAQWSEPPSRMQFSSGLYTGDPVLAQQTWESSREMVQITQRPIGPDVPGLLNPGYNLPIPETAEIVELQVGGRDAALIRGMWTRGVGEQNEPYRWNDRFWIWTLRWIDAVTFHEIVVMPRGGNIREDYYRDLIAEIGEAVATSRRR